MSSSLFRFYLKYSAIFSDSRIIFLSNSGVDSVTVVCLAMIAENSEEISLRSIWSS